MRYLIIGDVHANWPYLSQHIFNGVLARGVQFDEIIQVGDLGYYESSMGYFLHYAKKFGVPFHFIDGNHESHSFLNTTYKNLNIHGIFYHERGDITVLPNGTKIGWMGGAFNVDRAQDFWPDGSQNFPKKEEIAAFIEKVNAVGGVDLMVTHSCPHSIRVGMKGHPGFIPCIKEFVNKLGYPTGEIWDCGDQPLLDLWKGLIVKPTEWIFGHFHQHHQARVGTTIFRCVGACDHRFGQSRVYLYDSNDKHVYG